MQIETIDKTFIFFYQIRLNEANFKSFFTNDSNIVKYIITSNSNTIIHESFNRSVQIDIRIVDDNCSQTTILVAVLVYLVAVLVRLSVS